MLCSLCWFSDPTWPHHHNTSQRTGAQSAEPYKRHRPHAGFYMRENFALSAQGQLRIREHEQIGSEFIEAQVRASCGTARNVIKMIMFISMHLLSITQLVTVQQLLMFRFWAAGQIPRSTSDLSLIRYSTDNSPLGMGWRSTESYFQWGCWLQRNTFLAKLVVEHAYSRSEANKRNKQRKQNWISVSWGLLRRDFLVKVCFVC